MALETASRQKLFLSKGAEDLKFTIFICSNHWSWRNLNLVKPITLPTVLIQKLVLQDCLAGEPLVMFHAGHAFPSLEEERKGILGYIKESEIERQFR